MTDLVLDRDRWLDFDHPVSDGWDRDEEAGRHALDEDAVLTPIFHALTCVRQHEQAAAERMRELDRVDEFRRDPLTAPIPVQALTVPEQPWRRSASRLRSVTEHRDAVEDSGRHRLLRETSWR